MTPGRPDQCDSHAFTLPLRRVVPASGNLADFWGCEECDTVLYVESDRVTRKTVLTRNLDAADLTRTVGEDTR